MTSFSPSSRLAWSEDGTASARREAPRNYRVFRGGYQSMEKQPESEEDLLEHRTDGTDAFDTLFIGCEKFPQEVLTEGSVFSSGIS